MSLREDIISGTRYSALATAVQSTINFVVAIIIARLLAPEIFGLLAMATVFTGFSNLIVGFGTHDAIIRHEDVNRKFLSSIFWFNSSIALVVVIIMLLASGWIANFYGYPILRKIVRYTSLNILFSALAIVPRGVLQRNMNFRALFFEALIIAPISGSVAIYLAWRGFGVWSIVAQQMVSVIGGTFLVWMLVGWFPRASFDVKHIKQIFSYSSYLSLTKISNYFTKQGDLFLIGKFIGAESLGIYSKGYGLLTKPLKMINGIIIPVVFSAACKLQEDFSKLQSLYLKSTKSMAGIYFPLWVGSVFLAEPFVLILLGEQWRQVIPLLPIFTTNLMFLAQGSISIHYLKALGKTKKLFALVLISSFITFFSFVLGLQWGIRGVAIGYCVSIIIQYILITQSVGKYIDLPFHKILFALKIEFLCMIVMGLGIGITLYIISFTKINTYLFQLILGGGTGILFYIVIFWLVQPEIVHFIVKDILKLNKGKA